MLKLIECPRDAFQGIKEFIPTKIKAEYINSLLKVGFDTIDFGSFVSPKATPQLSDTKEVVKLLDLSDTKTKLLAIVANKKGAMDALEFNEIDYLGFPFSISNTFLKLNIRSTYQEGMNKIREINDVTTQKNRQLVVYISMAFGNPYGDHCCEEQLFETIEFLESSGIKIINLTDTVGMGKADDIGSVFYTIINRYPGIEFGLHLHTQSNNYYDIIEEAYNNGCRRFDSVMMGRGGNPFSGQQLVGNLNTELLIDFFSRKKMITQINRNNYLSAYAKATILFAK